MDCKSICILTVADFGERNFGAPVTYDLEAMEPTASTPIPTTVVLAVCFKTYDHERPSLNLTMLALCSADEKMCRKIYDTAREQHNKLAVLRSLQGSPVGISSVI